MIQSNTDEIAHIFNPSGAGAFVLACEHASNHIPPEFSSLGLATGLLASHIAWDPGAAAVAREMALMLDSPLVLHNISRLVCDSNRRPMSDEASPVESEVYRIPGNEGLSREQREMRAQRYYEPFRASLAGLVASRLERCEPPVLLTIHSFSPVYKGVRREVQIGLIDDGDCRFATGISGFLTAAGDFIVRRNEPYSRKDGVVHTLSVHASEHGLLHAMIEIRNDFLTDDNGQRRVARLLADCAQKALRSFSGAAVQAGGGA